MFEKIIRKATGTVKEVIEQEVLKDTKQTARVGLKIAGMVAVLAGIALAHKHSGFSAAPVKEVKSTAHTVYNFYNCDGEQILELVKF